MNISKTIFLITIIALAFTSCNSSRITQLETENVALKKQVDSLSSVAQTYRKVIKKEREMSQFSAMEAARLAKMAREKAEKAAALKK